MYIYIHLLACVISLPPQAALKSVSSAFNWVHISHCGLSLIPLSNPFLPLGKAKLHTWQILSEQLIHGWAVTLTVIPFCAGDLWLYRAGMRPSLPNPESSTIV